MKKILLITALSLFISAYGQSDTSAAKSTDQQKAPVSKKPDMAHMMPPAIVDTATPEKITWQPTLQSVGTVSAYEGTQITAEIAGRVTKIDAQSGQTIKAGDPIVEVFPNFLQATLRAAKAQLALDQITYERDEKLIGKGFISKQAFDQIKSTVEQDQAKVAEIESQLTQSIIVAPFSGQLGPLQISLGQYITPGTAIINLQRLDKLRVDFSIPSEYVPQSHLGEKVTFTNRAYPNKQFSGEITSMDSSINAQTRMLMMRASLDNKNYLLLPGAFMEATLYLDKPKEVLTVPETAILYSEAGAYVYLLSNQHTAVKHTVTLGDRLENNRIIISSGISLTDMVITSGQMKITANNSPVLTPEEAVAFFAHAFAKK
jgi:membrane fusion protein (multidrug efflux system)